MSRYIKSLLSAALVFAAGCVSVTIPSERVGVCSWSWQLPMVQVAEKMDAAGVKGIHLALGPFIAPDGRHGGAESADAWVFVKGKVAKGEWTVMSTMIGTVGEDYTTLATIRKTGHAGQGLPQAPWIHPANINRNNRKRQKHRSFHGRRQPDFGQKR